ncbi:LuxR C-terminal-related transcriptional regulator [Parafilimonas terrae]|uniref:Two component transcriptional regulator, LuxR family n=1 Tax=Parafilimonas terrae TaxID=1465490 RepID=A0A1I5TIN4_9BACT|nr:response regulator transcription factor [Parafilimonas terrae]SFP82885.1 two component transcriptional regulator, LuxR family [Parafilimonas terrae]
MTTEEKYKFIVIDDHPFTRDGIIGYVTAHEEFEFIGEFGDTRSVINSTFAGRPDIIILDLNLPGIDGAKSCGLLKQKFQKCKVVAFTQYEGMEKELEKLGFDGYIIKSEKDSLVPVLLAVLNGEKYFKTSAKKNVHTSEKLNKLDDYLKFKELTSREIEVAELLAEGFSNRETGEKLTISESTVETHRKHILEKLGVKSKSELFALLKKHLE